MAELFSFTMVGFFSSRQGNTIAGTTDTPTNVTRDPVATEKEISWILKEVENYLNPDIKVRRGDVLAAWSGIRPLVRDPSAKNTAALVRNHMINVSESGLLTIAGGKWTTYRAMAADTIDQAIEKFDLKPTNGCVTQHVQLYGSHTWHENMFVQLIQHFGLETQVAQHLSGSYGDASWSVASFASLSGHRWPVFGRRLVPYYPYIDAEVRYAVVKEYACTAVDVLARRTRLAFLNAYAALDALPRVIEIMSEELGWDEARRKKEFDDTVSFLKGMGLVIDGTAKRGVVSPTSDLVTFFSRSNFQPHELEALKKEFAHFDKQSVGYIEKEHFEEIMNHLGIKISKDEKDSIFAKCGLESHGARIAFSNFLEVLGVIKEIKSRQKFSSIVLSDDGRDSVAIDRSGGGV